MDPKWIEERNRQIQEKTDQEEVYAAGSSIESSLKHLAERRTDIFGAGSEEAGIGKKVGIKHIVITRKSFCSNNFEPCNNTIVFFIIFM